MATAVEFAKELRAKAERRYRDDIAAIDRVFMLLEEHLDTGTSQSVSQLDQVVAALTGANEKGMRVNEIAERTGMDPRAIRMVLYANRSRFRKIEISPRRVRWALQQEAATIT